MRKTLITAGAFALTLALSGCSVFYPNWGATGLPEEPEITVTTDSLQAETEVSEEPTQTQSEEPEASEEPTETSAPAAEKTKVTVEIIQAEVEADYGVLTVIAQIPGMLENGGKCIFRFIGSDKEVVKEVKAEQSSDYTQCFPVEFPLADLPSGNGIVTVGYESEKHTGLSAASSVVIP